MGRRLFISRALFDQREIEYNEETRNSKTINRALWKVATVMVPGKLSAVWLFIIGSVNSRDTGPDLGTYFPVPGPVSELK